MSRAEHAALEVDGRPQDVVSLRGREAVFELFSYEVTCAGNAWRAPDELLGAPVKLVLTDDAGHARTILGIVAEMTTRSGGGGHLRFVIRPRFFRLTAGRDCRAFADQSVPEIAADVLARDHVEARRELARDYAPRPRTVQWRESDHAFLMRLFEEEGLYTWFDHAAGSILVIGDTSTAAPEIEGGAAVVYRHGSGLTAGSDVVTRLGIEGEAAPSRFTFGSFDHERPEFEVLGDAGNGDGAFYDAAAGGSASPEILARRAADQVTASVAAGRRFRGETTSVRIAPGRRMLLTGHPTSVPGHELFVTEVEIEIHQRRSVGTEASFHSTFRAQRADLAWRPRHLTHAPRRFGLESGHVVGDHGAEVDPDALGRIRVQAHWDREGTSGTRLRVIQRATEGSLLMPRVGWNVYTQAEEGSPDAPVVANRLLDPHHPPPYPLPANKTRTTYKTATTPGGGSHNEIHFEDRGGAEMMHIGASRDLSTQVNNNRTEKIIADSDRKIGKDLSFDVGGLAEETVGGNQSVSVGGTESTKIGQARRLRITSDETSTIAGSRTLHAKGSATTSAEARALKVGASQIDISLGAMSESAETVHVLVGGALIRLTPRPITEYVGQAFSTSRYTSLAAGKAGGGLGGAVASALASKLPSFGVGVGGVLQTIGAAKVELAGKARTINVNGAYREVVGAAMMMKTPGPFTDQTLGVYSMRVGGKTKAQAPAIVVKADTIEISVGSTKLRVDKSDGVVLSSTTITVASAPVLNVAAQELHHNE